MEKNTELEKAWTIIEKTGANLFLTGKAGTGKTTFLKNLRKELPKRMVVLAPTGIAAINAGGVTIHSFFQLPLSPYVPGTTFGGAEKRYFRFSKVKRSILRTIDLLVIDEISMVRADLLDSIDSVMRRYREHDKPFGGVQLLMIGDLQQLAPVVKEEEWEMLKPYYPTPYFFSSKALAMAGYQTIELKTVYRQQDARFISLLNQIREKTATQETLAALNSRYVPDFKSVALDSDYIQLTTHNHTAQMINEHELKLLPSASCSFEAEVEGTFPETSYPADEHLDLKEGAQIMFIKNDAEKRFYNGMLGEVVSLDQRQIRVRDKKHGEVFVLEKAEWTNSKYTLDDESKEIKETVEGVFRQYPVRLAWAITIHKSQGLTFEHAIIDASHSFAHGQTYVALSRCKSLEGLILSHPLTMDAIISDRIVDEFTDKIDAMAPTKETISKLERAFVVQTIDELFDLIPLQRAYNLLLRTIDEYLYRRYPKMLTEYKLTGQKFQELIPVVQKFRLQYRRMLSEGMAVDSDQIQERIHKAARYFSTAIYSFYSLCLKSKINIENKAVKKLYDERYGVFAEEISLKRQLLVYEGGQSVRFSVTDYQRAKARILLGAVAGKEETAPKKKAASKQRAAKVTDPKPIKVATRQISYDLFMQGKTIEQVAEERHLAPTTVFAHLASYAKEGHLAMDKLMPYSHVNEIEAYVRSHPDVVTLAAIKEALGPDITYDEIRLVVDVVHHQE